MLHRDYATQICSVARSLEVVGERWTLLILRSVVQGFRRFDDLQRLLGVTRGVLTARLRHLVEHDVLERRRYCEHPPRDEYHLTAKGAELWPVIILLMQWGDRHYPEPDGAPVTLTHAACGGTPVDDLPCRKCGGPIDVDHVEVHLGPPLRRPPANGQAFGPPAT